MMKMSDRITIKSLDEMHPQVKKIFISMSVCCIYTKKLKLDKDWLLSFLCGVWDTMENNGADLLEKFLSNEIHKSVDKLKQKFDAQENLNSTSQESAQEQTDQAKRDQKKELVGGRRRIVPWFDFVGVT